ncbi:MAG: chromosome segregation protein SMC [Kiritimatiellia bacterium]
MYLKCLEMLGFKSFADSTKLEFEPGVTCIVGPNGCGKSNIADAVRWVLGEQSARAVRGLRMEDCIFNGTDSRKPLGMCEVSITFADCEEVLGTEYNEVTVTRRVFRSGEGQYFINKTPCRLKDIQRLFMDTGIGTSSYSIMEQGRIDQILSARPEDRRTVFEEASGITKFKADKKEAIRKLEHTEANLLRLADVIREVKRQIGSLQRQAAKARRYQELRSQLRRLDIYATRLRVRATDAEIESLEARIAELEEKRNSLQQEVTELERGIAALQSALVDTEREIGVATESASQAQSRLAHTRELIGLNHHRIEEYKQWTERDAKEIADTEEQIKAQRAALEELQIALAGEQSEHEAAEAQLQATQSQLASHLRHIEALRARAKQLEEENVECESLAAKLQNHLLELDAEGRTTVIRRERLAAEKNQLTRTVATFEKRQTEMERLLETMRDELAAAQRDLGQLEEEKKKITTKTEQLQQKSNDLRLRLAEKKATIRLLEENQAGMGDLPAGSRFLLQQVNQSDSEANRILGALASHVNAEPGFEVALEAALRAWLDAVVVADSGAALRMLAILEQERPGPARLVALDGCQSPSPATEGRGELLIEHVQCSPQVKSWLSGVLGSVRVVNSAQEIPSPLPFDVVYVTRTGCVARENGQMEFWMPTQHVANPFSLKHLLDQGKKELESLRGEIRSLENEITTLVSRAEELNAAVSSAQTRVAECRHRLSQKEGENHVLMREAREARERLDTVAWEYESLMNQGTSGEEQRQEIERQLQEARSHKERLTADLSEQNRLLREAESIHAKMSAEIMEHRIRVNSLGEKLAHLRAQFESGSRRLSELQSLVQTRSAGLASYAQAINQLTEQIAHAEQQLEALEAQVAASQEKAEALRRNREKQFHELRAMKEKLAVKREQLENIRNAKSAQEVARAECVMRRQNQIDRLAAEYGITFEAALQEPDPVREGNHVLSLDAADTLVAELKAKIEAMGPVNLVAIQEYKGLEERHSFLTTQEQDLARAKHQLMEMIRRINRTTTEMFSTTFAKINENFQTMFRKLFDGGQAKLVLVDEADVLECGIEIIARPPGKRLTNITLLSGGERTLTAVSLLFAIYMIKPSPFCLLDELDAALDETNINHFLRLLQEFRHQSQFVVITHNRQTIAQADVLYGVTMEEKGISKIVSMRFSDYEAASSRSDPNPAQTGR